MWHIFGSVSMVSISRKMSMPVGFELTVSQAKHGFKDNDQQLELGLKIHLANVVDITLV